MNSEEHLATVEPAAMQAYATQVGTPATASGDETTVALPEAEGEPADGFAPVVAEAPADTEAGSVPSRQVSESPPSVVPPTVTPHAASSEASIARGPTGGASGRGTSALTDNESLGAGSQSLGAIGTGTIGTGTIGAGTIESLGPMPRPPRDAIADQVVRLSQRPATGYEPKPASPSDRAFPGLPSPPGGPMAEPPGSSYLDLDSYLDDGRGGYEGEWSWQLLPSSLIYKSYLAGLKESRLASQHVNISGDGWLWDAVLGGRIGLLRYGDRDPILPNGWQIDAEGSAQVRLDVTNDVNVRAVDYRGGLPITYGAGRFRTKFGYYHLSSHLGDEFLLENPGYPRLNYSRDCFVLGETFYITERLRVYAELAWAFHSDVSDPWEFQFGVDYSPIAPTGFSGAPFFAANGHLRQELNYSGHFTLQTGWAWVSDENGRLLRLGFQYVNGLSTQYSFYHQFEQQIGMGLWYDF
ncbi:MAG: DUF1207 domain-containing protein [Planctomycetota bacterium]